jgi:hypothetical protein
MSSPTVVFLRSGFISFVVGLMVWLLVLLLCYESSDKLPNSISYNSSKDAEILKDLEVTATLPSGTDTALPAVERRVAWRGVSYGTSKHDNIIDELDVSAAPTAHAKLQPPSDNLPENATTPSRSETVPSQVEQRAAVDPIGALITTHTAQLRVHRGGHTTLEDVSSTNGIASQALSAFTGALLEPPPPKTYKPASPPSAAILPTPPMPQRHPYRIAALQEPLTDDEPRSIQAIIPRWPSKPPLAGESALSFLAKLWRPAKPVERSGHVSMCRGDGGVGSTAPCSRVGTRLLRQ